MLHVDPDTAGPGIHDSCGTDPRFLGPAGMDMTAYGEPRSCALDRLEDGTASQMGTPDKIDMTVRGRMCDQNGPFRAPLEKRTGFVLTQVKAPVAERSHGNSATEAPEVHVSDPAPVAVEYPCSLPALAGPDEFGIRLAISGNENRRCGRRRENLHRELKPRTHDAEVSRAHEHVRVRGSIDQLPRRPEVAVHVTEHQKSHGSSGFGAGEPVE